MLVRFEIEQPRTPRGLRQFVTRRVDKVKRTTSERHMAMQKKALYKEFNDEIVPLSIFALKAYPNNYRIKPVLGNQGYDALVFDDGGNEVDRVEMTLPQYGAVAAADARLAVNRGYGHIHVYNPGDNLAKLIPQIIETSKKKAKNNYADCTLVVALDFIPPLKIHRSLYKDMINDLVTNLRQINFRARRVFLLIMPFRELKKIYG